MKRSFLLSCCIAVVAFCVAVPVANALKSEPKTKVNTINVHDRYSINLPTYFTKAYELNSEASLEYQNEAKEVYIIIIDESTDEFVTVFKELNAYDSTKSAIDNYVRAQTESIRENMSKVTVESPLRKVQTQSGEALVYDMAGFQDGIDEEMGFTVAFMQGKNCLYMLMTWTFQKSKSVYQNDMDNMIISFKELSGAIDTFPHQIKTDKYIADIAHGFVSDTTPCTQNCLGYSRVKGNIFLSISEFEQESWKESYKTWPDRKTYSLLEFFTLDQKNFQVKNAPQGTTHSELKKGKINGAAYCSFSSTRPATDETSSWHYESFIVQGKQHFFYILIYCPVEDLPANQADIQAIYDSFRLL